MIDRSCDVLIVGGGIMGCVTAYHLAKEGVDVLVLERSELNREASGTNAGNFHFQVTRLDENSPVVMAGVKARLALSRAAADVWRDLEKDLGADLGVRMRGGLLVAETPDQVELLKRKVALERAAGLDVQVLSGREARELAPELAPDILAADYLAEEGFGNPLLLAPAFARRAIEHGARFQLHCTVTAIERRARGGFIVETSTGRFEAGRVVDAAGAWAGEIAAMVGLSVPIEGHVITVNVTEPAPFTLKQMIQHIGRKLTMKQSQYGTFIIGGGWSGEWVPERSFKGTRMESTAGNLHNAARVVPALSQLRLLRTWGGMSGTTPGYAPIIGESSREPGFFVLVGGAGFTVGPLNGRLMAELLTTGKPSVPLGQFALDAVAQMRTA